MNITAPQITDKEEIKQLFNVVITQNFKDYGYYDTYRDDIAYEVGKQIAALDQYFQSNGKKVFFLVAKDNNKVIGTIAYGQPNPDIKKYYKKNLHHIPEVKSTYILPEYQGQGIGTELLHEIMDALRKNGIKEFCLESGYPKAQQFWTHRLGNPVVKIHNRWGAGNDYLIWHYTL